MVATTPASAESDGPALVSFRDRIVSAFVAHEPLDTVILFQHDDAVAALRLPSGTQVTLVTCPPGTSPEVLRPMFEAIIERATGEMHLVLVGGDRQVARALKTCFPFWQLSRRLGFHQVRTGGKVKRITGARLGMLKQVVSDAPTAPELTGERVASLVAHGREMNTHEVRLDTALRGRLPWVTTALAVACIALYALGLMWADGDDALALYRMGANNPPDVKDGELWRLGASAFLHANAPHIIVNMIALAGFGPVLERLLGPQRYILLYALSAFGGSLASALLRSEGLSVGASGAIWGLMAAGVALAIWPRGLLPPLSLQKLRGRVVAPLAINVLYSFTPGVDLLAHFGGGLVGFALIGAGILTRGVTPLWTAGSGEPQQRRGAHGALTVGALVVAILFLGTVVMAMAVGRPWQIAEPPQLVRVQVADTGFAMNMPSNIAGAPVVERKDSVWIYTYGNLMKARVVIEFVVNVLPQAVTPAELPEMMNIELKALREHAPPETEREQAPQLVTVGDHPFATTTDRFKNSNVRLRSWVSVFGDREVVLRVYVRPDATARWAGLGDSILGSLQRIGAR
jgi:rhomboid protease GluP